MAELQPGDEFAGYRIEGIAGRGGMGVVYRATQLALDRVVALKLIAPDFAEDPSFRDRFKRESRTAAKIEHPHVITVYEAGEANGQLFISMRFIEGTDLKALINREGGLAPPRTATIVNQVAGALDAAHAHGLIHRDIKPGNVLIASDNGSDHAFLTDFGLTKHLAASTSGMTKTGTWVGTLDYVAPEQISGGQVDARSDIYSLGCVVFQTLTGEVPYQRDSDVAKLWAHMHDPPPSVSESKPDLPSEWERVIRRAMAKEPDDRYLSAGDLGRAALAAAQGEMLTSPERSVATGAAAPQLTGIGKQPQAARGARRPWLVPALAALAAAALAAGVTAALVGGGDDGSSGEAEGEVVTNAGESFTVTPFRVDGATNVTVGEGAAWVMAYEKDEVTRIDESTGEMETFDDVGDGPVVAALGGDYLWIGQADSGTIGRFDLESRQLVGGAIDVPPSEGDSMAFGGDFLYVAVIDQGRVAKIDSEGKVVKGPPPLETGVGPELAVDDTAIWVANLGMPTITRIPLDGGDPKAVTVGKDPPDDNDFRGQVAIAEDAVWASSPEDDTVTRLDLEGNVVETLKMPRGLEGDLEVANGLVWVTNDYEQLERIDPETNKLMESPVPAGIGGTGQFEVAGEASWATGDPERDTVTRIGF